MQYQSAKSEAISHRSYAIPAFLEFLSPFSHISVLTSAASIINHC